MEHLLNIKDAAEFLNVSEMTIRRWTNLEKLKWYRLGGRRLDPSKRLGLNGSQGFGRNTGSYASCQKRASSLPIQSG